MSIWSRISSLVRKPRPQAKAFGEQLWLDDLHIGGRSAAGRYVDWKSALESPTALRAGLLISDGVSTVPCKLMRKDPATGSRAEARDHPLFDIMTYRPCDWMTSQQFRETMMLRTTFDGNAFAYINRVGPGRIREIFPFDRDEVQVQKRQGGYDRSPLYLVNGEEVPADRILHFRGPSWDGRRGLDMVSLASEVLGLADAAQEAHAKRFANGVQSSGAWITDKPLDEKQQSRLTAYVAKHYGGSGNAGKPLILDNGTNWVPLEMTGVDAEHLAVRMYLDMLVARFYGVLPIMLGIADKTATYASAEQMFLAHAVHTIRPWHRRIAEILNCFLLTAAERAAGYYFHFVDTALLRGAAKDRAEFYAKLFSVGALSPNKVMEFEDMDGFDGGDGHYVPANVGLVQPDGSLKTSANGGGMLSDPSARLRVNVGRILSTENEGLIRAASDNLTTVLAKIDGQAQE